MVRHESTESEESAVGLRFVYRAGEGPTSPLIVLIHGRAGNRSVMWTFERSIPSDCHVVAFEAFLPDPIGGWSWWEMSSELGVNREQVSLAADRLARALKAFVAEYALMPLKTIGMGFSQGGMLLSYAALTGIIECTGVAVLAGLVMPQAEKIKIIAIPEFFVAHGTLDETIAVSKAREGVSYLEQQGVKVRYVEEDVGHKVGVVGTRTLKGWLQELLDT